MAHISPPHGNLNKKTKDKNHPASLTINTLFSQSFNRRRFVLTIRFRTGHYSSFTCAPGSNIRYGPVTRHVQF